MDPRLNLAILESHESDLDAGTRTRPARQRRWPDDGQPARAPAASAGAWGPCTRRRSWPRS